MDVLLCRVVRLRVDNTCPVEIRHFSDPLCPSSDPTTAVIVGVTVPVIAVLVVLAVIVAVLVFVAVRRHKYLLGKCDSACVNCMI